MLNLFSRTPRHCMVAITAVVLIATGCQTRGDAGREIVIEHVTVLSMAEGSAPIKDAAVLIRNGRIEKVSPGQRIRAGSQAVCIDGRGKFLMPGLTDMHTHPENAGLFRSLSGVADLPEMTQEENEDVFLPYIAHGVTQILNMSANANAIAQRDAIERGDSLGPQMALAAMVDGAPRLSPFATEMSGPEEGKRFVRDAHSAGYDFIKVYSMLDEATFDAIIEEARRLQIRVIGHIPGRGANMPERFLQPGFVMVGHAEEFAFQGESVARSEESIPAYVALLKRTGVHLTSTLTLDERIVEQARDPASVRQRTELRYLSPAVRGFWTQGNPYTAQGPSYASYVASIVAFNAKLVKASFDAGVPVLPGTDANVPGLVPGASLHDEFEALARAGLPHQEILEAATRRASEFLGTGQDRGTIEVGKRADLLLLEADPLADIRNTRRIAAVFVNGRVLTASELESRMEGLAARRTDPSLP